MQQSNTNDHLLQTRLHVQYVEYIATYLSCVWCAYLFSIVGQTEYNCNYIKTINEKVYHSTILSEIGTVLRTIEVCFRYLFSF